jgi:hypothetical protein
MKYFIIILLLIPFELMAQDGRNLVKDKMYKKHSDSVVYYRTLWEKSGYKNFYYEDRMKYFRQKAADREWGIYDSTRKAAKKP